MPTSSQSHSYYVGLPTNNWRIAPVLLLQLHDTVVCPRPGLSTKEQPARRPAIHGLNTEQSSPERTIMTDKRRQSPDIFGADVDATQELHLFLVCREFHYIIPNSIGEGGNLHHATQNLHTNNTA